MTKKPGSVILGVTGGIAAYRACDIISILKKRSIDVTVLMTKEAEEFVTPLTFQTLSQNKIYRDLFAMPDEWNPVHTSLADRADLVLIAPATANVIGKIASGICDDILTCAVFATKAPVLFAPAMNEKMYQHRIVQENIKKLKNIGYHFVGPVKGRLACGHEAIGHIADTDQIVREVNKLLKWD
jgi:phosphopantothenoylcysteine decarboxylase/phosphopantothenate--cysteine ligase